MFKEKRLFSPGQLFATIIKLYHTLTYLPYKFTESGAKNVTVSLGFPRWVHSPGHLKHSKHSSPVGSPAQVAGIRGTTRKIIVCTDDDDVANESDLFKAIEKHAVGDEVSLKVLRQQGQGSSGLSGQAGCGQCEGEDSGEQSTRRDGSRTVPRSEELVDIRQAVAASIKA
jgi:hypothetical protein